NREASFPKNMPALGCILGIVGLSVFVPPFLREMNPAGKSWPVVSGAAPPSLVKALAIVFTVAIGVALLLATRAIPFHFVRGFQGAYLAVFLLLAGVVTLAVSHESLPPLNSLRPSKLVRTAASALVLVLLYAGWFELIFYEAWLTPARWLRFPLLLLL